jgi:hypothetical protein
MKKILLPSLIVMMSAITMLAIDKVVIKNGEETLEGKIEGYKNDGFKLKQADGKQITIPKMSVDSVTLDPPANAIVKMRSAGKKREDLKFKGYEKPDFIFAEENGKEIKIPASEITFVAIGLDFAREMALANEPTQGKNGEKGEKQANDEDVEVEDMLKKGMVTIIYFEPSGDKFEAEMKVAGTRSESYILAQEKKMKGKLAVVKIPVPGWDAPVAKKYKITSLPQFWFYNREGKLVTKLVDRFTTVDIDTALKAARK